MGQCKPFVTISTVYDCATFCKKWNEPPIPSFFYGKFHLIQNSSFFDSGIIADRLFKWTFKSSGYVFYETAWGKSSQVVTEMNNGSTYGAIRLGFENNNIVSFINSLPNTEITPSPKGVYPPIEITLSVRDCDGIENKVQSNKFKFNKK